MLTDTIAAISTPLGEGGIAVIRMSGQDAVRLADKVFRSRTKLADAKSHTVHYGHIVNPETNERLEEALVTVMRAPRSFTKEDVVEIGCHGGIMSVKNVLGLLLDQGARLAEPGEFTKRAFLNGRIDLAQAEAVIDLIRAKSDRAFKNALKQAEGALSKPIRQIRRRLVELMAHIEVNIDYPEHDVPEMTSSLIKKTCSEAIGELDRLLKTAEQGKVLREGIVTAIVGRPNVGKSSLLNALARENKAIVTDIPGTTRDVIEEYVTLNGIPLRLLDTAGIRETADVVERIGVEKSRGAMEEADLVLFVVNHHEPLTEEEAELLDRLKGKPCLVLVNKIDLPKRIDIAKLESYVPPERIVLMSVKEEKGLDDLERAISKLFFGGELENGDTTYVSNIRHIHLLKKARQSLEEASRAADDSVPIDIIQIDIRAAWESLGEVTGETAGESLIDQIFSQFCLGK